MINRLYEVLDKRGPKYVENFLKENVIITEKIDTFRLIFEKKGDQYIFYKKNNEKIDLPSRVLTDIYEDAITEIPLITKDVNIPEGYFFGFYYTPTERPLRIPYSKIPKYILTDVTKRNSYNKIVESLDYDEVKNWASILCMGRPPILFEGKLTDEQKRLLIAYDTKQYNGETLTFSEMIKKTLGASYSKEDIIEGIIIKSGDKLAQIISYEFELLNEAYEKENESRDFYDIIITDLSNFLSNYNIPILEAENKDELYLNIIYNIFNNYCKNKVIDENLDEKYLTPLQFGYNGKLNKKLITNEETLELINKAPIYEALFKVFLSSLRKTKKPHGLLNETIVEKFNNYVNLINNYINNFKEVKDQQLFESRSDNVVIDEIKKRKYTDIDNMRVISSIQKTFEPIISNAKRGETKCAVYITSFEPFTISQMNNVQIINKNWNCPVVLMSISNKHNLIGTEFYPSDNLIEAQMKSLSENNPELIPFYSLLSTWSLKEIFELCRPRFEPIVIITDKGKKSEIAIQLFFEEEVMGGRINVQKDLNVGELENEDKLNAFRAIEDNNYSLFMELTPKCIHNLFNNIFEEYRLWSGKILR